MLMDVSEWCRVFIRQTGLGVGQARITDSSRASIARITGWVRNLLTIRIELGFFSSWTSLLLYSHDSQSR